MDREDLKNLLKAHNNEPLAMTVVLYLNEKKEPDTDLLRTEKITLPATTEEAPAEEEIVVPKPQEK